MHRRREGAFAEEQRRHRIPQRRQLLGVQRTGLPVDAHDEAVQPRRFPALDVRIAQGVQDGVAGGACDSRRGAAGLCGASLLQPGGCPAMLSYAVHRLDLSSPTCVQRGGNGVSGGLECLALLDQSASPEGVTHP